MALQQLVERVSSIAKKTTKKITKLIQSQLQQWINGSNTGGFGASAYDRKEYRIVHEDGTLWKKIVKWFGYKLHLIVDATYELPVMFSLQPLTFPVMMG